MSHSSYVDSNSGVHERNRSLLSKIKSGKESENLKENDEVSEACTKSEITFPEKFSVENSKSGHRNLNCVDLIAQSMINQGLDNSGADSDLACSEHMLFLYCDDDDESEYYSSKGTVLANLHSEIFWECSELELADYAPLMASALGEGKQVHVDAVKFGLDSDAYGGNNLINFYGCCKKVLDVHKVFDKILERLTVSSQAFYNDRFPLFADSKILAIEHADIDGIERLALVTGSDCEVIVHLYEEYGEEFVDILDGMFSFVLIDTRDKSFIAARDAIGITPLNLGFDHDGSTWFASEMKALIDDCERFIFFLPGHIYSRKQGGLRRWYNPPWYFEHIPSTPYDPIILREAFERAVYKRMMIETDSPYHETKNTHAGIVVGT
ncbi:Nucleophile aminohydrolase, N-terminal [Sesbania bispinosa]|nr:Nucleophile aminohydrolase, N-terminal [Sesbania bispinosa]